MQNTINITVIGAEASNENGSTTKTRNTVIIIIDEHAGGKISQRFCVKKKIKTWPICSKTTY